MRFIYIAIYLISLIFISACAPSLTFASKQYAENNNLSSSSQLQKAFLIAVNKVRSKARVCGEKYFSAAPALSLNINLNKAAYNHSLDMHENQFLEHVGSNGDTLVERMQKANYSWSAVAENIAHNQKNITQVIEGWLSSPGHCSNMMSTNYTQTGVAQVNRYWTQVYAAPK